jgi:hypothetical protein
MERFQALPHFYSVAALFGKLQCAEAILLRLIFSVLSATYFAVHRESLDGVQFRLERADRGDQAGRVDSRAPHSL